MRNSQLNKIENDKEKCGDAIYDLGQLNPLSVQLLPVPGKLHLTDQQLNGVHSGVSALFWLLGVNKPTL